MSRTIFSFLIPVSGLCVIVNHTKKKWFVYTRAKEKISFNCMSYERLTHVEHILKRPDTYVGSLAPESSTQWTRVAGHFEPTLCHVSPALVKIFDEVLVNAIDQYSLYPKKVKRIDNFTPKLI